MKHRHFEKFGTAMKKDDTHISPTATFLLCAESGYFETQTVLAIECLRSFGGALAGAPILVVTPRQGPSLDPTTMRRLRELDARYIYQDVRSNLDWYAYMNKASAARLADKLVKTEQIIWLDSDVLVVSTPTPLLLQHDEDFACCSLDKNVGTCGPADPNDQYWQALCAHYGIPLERLPLVRTSHDDQLVRFRLHSGVYSFRVGLGLGQAFSTDLESMLRSGVGFSRTLPFPGDDVALAYSVVRLELRWRQLPMSCNFEMTPNSRVYSRSNAANAAVLHFHKALASPEGAKWFLRELETFRPDVAEWLASRVPLSTKTGGFRKSIIRRLLGDLRRYKQRRREAQCTFMAP